MFALDRATHPMVFTDGVRTVRFSDCIINDVSPAINGDGSQSMSIAILDRRWKWRYGQISGRYNIRMASGLIESGTKKSARELIVLCFAALNERRFNASLVPDTVFPHVDWDMESPSAALEQLCQSLNCHVCLGVDDVAYVYPDGFGNELPNVPSSSAGVGFEFGTLPGQVGAASAPMMFQLDFRLIPVGLDVDGQIKEIDSLSYTPVYGSAFRQKLNHWHLTDPSTMATVNRRYRRLAMETVWRWYRIELPKNFKKMPVANLDVVSSRQFFPLLDHQLAYDTVSEIDKTLRGGAFDEKTRQRKPQQVWGVFYDDGGTGDDNTVQDATANKSVPPYAPPANPSLQNLESEFGKRLIYGKSFTVDNELRVVKFADPVYRIRPFVNANGKQDGYWSEPELYLRTACNFYHPENRAAFRLQKRIPIRGAADRSLIDWTYREDVVPEWRQRHTGGVEFNRSEVEESLNYYLQYQLAKYETKIPGHIEVPWLLPYSPDGRIAQVVFEIAGDGFMKTSIHRELEGLNSVVDYKARRAEVRRLATEQRLARQFQQQDRAKGKQ